MTATATGPWPPAVQSGVICATAGRSQREMRRWAAAYPGLFAAKPFDEALYGTVALAMAFSGPWLTADRLAVANKATLWAFALDWLVDYAGGSPAEMRGLRERCAAVAAGAEPAPGDELALMLADIRRDLAPAPAFAELERVWLEELGRTLDAMIREWEWKASGTTPTVEEYLANADNHAFCFVFTCHWISVAEPGAAAGLDRVREASRAVQRVMRLLNDVSSYDRDVSWGDVNVLLLGTTREEVTRRVGALAAEARGLLAELRSGHPETADYMERQMDFCAGFYQAGEYWGRL
ncbi:terpene synthase family protein [Sphaerisporangium sp. TRM90804]|uniref:terpene synthase family protein n=1 Tax=Sphaerisporangium sp. TRM90804 TaxID=3031113 RepID=UPI00244B4F6B|nr:terpene synthase family protein [Sphaerisporangium sp. TRM90804]MDH2424672.1 terpene synthase family protein [Sphaerisporangium sp. TRM90804]